MMTIALLLFAHFIADFLLQPRWMAVNKSIKFKVLVQHCAIQGGVFLVFCLVLFNPLDALIISIMNTMLHGCIDWNIWRGYKYFRRHEDIKTFPWWEDHWFFVTIGADQLLHGISILFALWIVI